MSMDFEDDFDRLGEIVTIRKQFKQFGIEAEDLDPDLGPLRDKVWASNPASRSKNPGQLVNILTGEPAEKQEK